MKFVDKKYNFLKAVKTPNLVRLGRKNKEIDYICKTLIKILD